MLAITLTREQFAKLLTITPDSSLIFYIILKDTIVTIHIGIAAVGWLSITVDDTYPIDEFMKEASPFLALEALP